MSRPEPVQVNWEEVVQKSEPTPDSGEQDPETRSSFKEELLELLEKVQQAYSENSIESLERHPIPEPIWQETNPLLHDPDDFIYYEEPTFVQIDSLREYVDNHVEWTYEFSAYRPAVIKEISQRYGLNESEADELLKEAAREDWILYPPQDIVFYEEPRTNYQ